jgi:hypothetical protein
MQTVTIGLDIAKSVLQVHGVDADGQVIIRRHIRCNPPRLIAREWLVPPAVVCSILSFVFSLSRSARRSRRWDIHVH